MKKKIVILIVIVLVIAVLVAGFYFANHKGINYSPSDDTCEVGLIRCYDICCSPNDGCTFDPCTFYERDVLGTCTEDHGVCVSKPPPPPPPPPSGSD